MNDNLSMESSSNIEPPMVAALDHVNIVVEEMERSVAFYQRVLGLEKGFEGTLAGEWIDSVTGLQGVEARCVFMESPGIPVRLELLQYLQPVTGAFPEAGLPHLPGVRHIAFCVPDLDQFYQHGLAAGASFVSPPVLVPFLLPGARRKRLCYFHDPDGVLLEAAEYCDEGVRG